MRKILFNISLLVLILSILFLCFSQSEIFEKTAGAKLLYESPFGQCYSCKKDVLSPEKLGFFETHREYISGDLYLYGFVPFPVRKVYDDGFSFNCQILIKKSGDVKIGLPLIYTSSTLQSPPKTSTTD